MQVNIFGKKLQNKFILKQNYTYENKTNQTNSNDEKTQLTSSKKEVKSCEERLFTPVTSSIDICLRAIQINPSKPDKFGE